MFQLPKFYRKIIESYFERLTKTTSEITFEFGGPKAGHSE